MRTKNLFRTVIATALTVVSINAFGQGKTTTGTANTVRATTTNIPTATRPEAVDFVTIGSKMPYSVTPDANVAAAVDGINFLVSEYNWRVDIDPAAGTNTLTPAATNDATRTVRAADGTTVLSAATTADYYTNTDVTVNWLAIGQYDITVKEQSRNTLGFPFCSGIDSSVRVYVMPKPTATFIEAGTLAGATNIEGTINNDAIVGGCGVANTTVSFNVTFTGTEAYAIAYQSVFTPFSTGIPGAAVPATATGLGLLNFYSATPAVPNTEALTGVFTFAVPAATYGKYVFTLTSVTDRISRKTLADANGNGTANDQDPGTLVNTTGAAAPILTLYSLPTPTTGAVRHVDNSVTGW